MTEPTVTALDQILDVARAALRARHADTVERADRIRGALDAYVTALAAEIAGEFATKNGLAALPTGQSALGAALALRAAVEGLPELRARGAVAPEVTLTPPLGIRPSTAAAAAGPIVEHVVARHVPAAPGSSSGWRGTDDQQQHESHAVTVAARPERRPAELDPIANALIRDVQQLDLARMPSHQFRVWAEELAARARALQDKGADPDEVPGRVIRKLTAIAYEKGIGDIFGLNRKHSANWDEVADRARARREAALNANAVNEKAAAEKAAADKIAADKLAVEKAAQKAIADAAKKQEREREKAAEPERLAAAKAEKAAEKAERAAEREREKAEKEEAAKAAEAAESDPDPASGKRELPLLRAIAKRMPVIFVGGVVKQEKVALIQQKHGVEVEWIDTSRHGTQAISGLEKRIRENRLAAVVVLQGLIGHKHFEPIVAAARQVGIPFAYADKAGLGSVVRAFNEVEKQLGDAQEKTG